MADKKLGARGASARVGEEAGDDVLELDYEMAEFLEAGPSRPATTTAATGSQKERTEEVVKRVVDEQLAGCMNVFMEKMLATMTSLVGEQASGSRNVTGATSKARQTTAEQRTRVNDDGVEAARRRGDLMEVGGIVEEFDPEDHYSNVNKFLGLIDQLGDVHGWSAYERSYLMQVKLRGAARSWFRRLDNIDFTWDQWKVHLQRAFPRQHDFHDSMAEMMERRKEVGEMMTSYFHAKLALCERVKVTDEDAVSCIIKGLPQELWANACACKSKTPEALYSDFLSGLEEHKSPAAVVVARQVEPSTPGVKSKRGGSSSAPPSKRQESRDRMSSPTSSQS